MNLDKIAIVSTPIGLLDKITSLIPHFYGTTRCWKVYHVQFSTFRAILHMYIITRNMYSTFTSRSHSYSIRIPSTGSETIAFTLRLCGEIKVYKSINNLNLNGYTWVMSFQVEQTLISCTYKLWAVRIIQQKWIFF